MRLRGHNVYARQIWSQSLWRTCLFWRRLAYIRSKYLTRFVVNSSAVWGTCGKTSGRGPNRRKSSKMSLIVGIVQQAEDNFCRSAQFFPSSWRLLILTKGAVSRPGQRHWLASWESSAPVVRSAMDSSLLSSVARSLVTTQHASTDIKAQMYYCG